MADQLSDAELVHTVCRRERLTFYNFLLQRGDQDEDIIKQQINREYGFYFRKQGQEPGRGRVLDIHKRSFFELGNPIDKKLSV